MSEVIFHLCFGIFQLISPNIFHQEGHYRKPLSSQRERKLSLTNANILIIEIIISVSSIYKKRETVILLGTLFHSYITSVLVFRKQRFLLQQAPNQVRFICSIKGYTSKPPLSGLLYSHPVS
jgi:hypothetical protein